MQLQEESSTKSRSKGEDGLSAALGSQPSCMPFHLVFSAIGGMAPATATAYNRLASVLAVSDWLAHITTSIVSCSSGVNGNNSMLATSLAFGGGGKGGLAG